MLGNSGYELFCRGDGKVLLVFAVGHPGMVDHHTGIIVVVQFESQIFLISLIKTSGIINRMSRLEFHARFRGKNIVVEYEGCNASSIVVVPKETMLIIHPEQKLPN